MIANKFHKYFNQSILNEAIPSPIDKHMADEDAFAGSFEDQNVAQQLDGEIESAAIDENQKAAILKKADKYSEIITNSILPTLREIQNDILSGIFSSIGVEVKGISGINEDLARLGEALRGRSRDAILKATKNEEN